MKNYELLNHIEGLQEYKKVMNLDDWTLTALDRVISDMEDTYETMISQGLCTINEV